MKPTRSYYSRLFKAISWLFLGMTALYIVVQAFVATLDFLVQYMFERKSSKLTKFQI